MEQSTADFADVGKKVALVLEAADKSATEMREAATREAEEIRGRAQAEAAEMKSAWTKLQKEVESEVAAERDAAAREAEETRAGAEDEARHVVSSAERKAASIAKATAGQRRELELAITAGEQRLRDLAATLEDLAARLRETVGADAPREQARIRSQADDETDVVEALHDRATTSDAPEGDAAPGEESDSSLVG